MNRSRLSDSQGRRHLGLRIKMTSVRTSFLADRCLNARDTTNHRALRDMPSQIEIRQRITNQIIDALKSGNLPPWRKPWASHRNAGFPTNVVSKRSYSGINPMLLLLSAEKHDFRTKWWGTYRQWEQLGGNVMRRPEEC